MTKTAHTPGPWIVDEYDVITAWTVHDDDYPSEPLHRLIVNDCNYSGWADLAVPLANAHLIAAAPDMLEALKECLPLFDMVTALDDHGSNALGQAENLIRAAISKAEGQP